MKNKKFLASAVSAALVASVVAPVVADAATGNATSKTNIKDVRLYGATKAKVYYSKGGKTVSKDVALKLPVKHLSTYAVIPWEGKNVRWNFNERVQLPQQKSYAKYIAKAKAAVAAKDAKNAEINLEIAKKHLDNMNVAHFSASTIANYKASVAGVEKQLEELKVPAKVEIAALTATDEKKLEVKFNTAVDTSKAKIEVKKAGVTVDVSHVTFSEDKTSATLELATKLAKGEYTVYVSGLTEEVLTKSVVVEGEVEVAALTATGAKKLEVKFNTAVDASKAKIEVKRAGVAVNVSRVTFSEDKTSATLELATKLVKGEYTIHVSGAAEEILTKSVAVEDEKVQSVEILSDIAVVNDTTNPTSATVSYQVLNQYGEDITKTIALTTNDPSKIVAANGVVTMTLSGVKVGDKLPVTLIDIQSAASATKVVTLSASSAVSEVAITGVYNKDGKELNEDSNLSSDSYYLLLDLKDQYGRAITDKALAEKGLIKSQSNPTVVGTEGASNAVTLTKLTVNGKDVFGLKLTGPVTAGENLVTLISTSTGKNASYKVTIAEATRADVVTLSAPSLAVANEDLYVPVTALDKSGKAITDSKVLNHGTKGAKVSINGTTLSNAFVTKDNALYMKVPKANVANEGIYSFVVQSSSYKVATLTLNVKKAAEATVIRGLKSDVSTTILANEVATLDVKDLVIEDQYGRVMDSAVVKAGLTGGKKIVAKKVDASANVVTVTSVDLTDSATIQLTAGAANGSERITFVLNNGTSDLVSSTAEVAFRVTNGTEYKSYEVEEIGTIYDEEGAAKTNHEAYDKEIKVYGVLDDGSKVRLKAGVDYTVNSSFGALATDAQDGKIAADTLGLVYEDKATEKALDLTVTINATGQEFTKTVKFSKVAPKVANITFVNNNVVDAAAISELVLSGTSFSIADLTAGASNTNMVVTDQYGVKVVATQATGAITFADTTTVVAPVLTVTPVKGELTITNNGLANLNVDAVDVNDEFSVKVTYAGGASATLTVKK